MSNGIPHFEWRRAGDHQMLRAREGEIYEVRSSKHVGIYDGMHPREVIAEIEKAAKAFGCDPAVYLVGSDEEGIDLQVRGWNPANDYHTNKIESFLAELDVQQAAHDRKVAADLIARGIVRADGDKVRIQGVEP